MNRKDTAREIYQKYQARLRKFISNKVGSEQDIEEILQESLIAAVDCLPLYSGKSTLFTWICGIARHEIADYYRKKKIKTFLFSHLPWLEELAHDALGPEQIFMRRELEEKVKKTLSRLSEGYAEVLRLKYYQGLSVEQIAIKLNETVKGVESKLFRARQAFIKVYTTDAS